MTNRRGRKRIVKQKFQQQSSQVTDIHQTNLATCEALAEGYFCSGVRILKAGVRRLTSFLYIANSLSYFNCTPDIFLPRMKKNAKMECPRNFKRCRPPD
ncbi:uncharacterized protein LOC102448694 isoform X3 [Pelodiscus sinensis]|uniref:uncharacterized protein LOC102448694 isoform X3 n=1 Tax=Pelodiscus sinensis TaxID=13735 RepID=UPI003F6B53EA